MSSNCEIPKIFISYSHDSTSHLARVLELSDRLRGDGIDAIIDQYVPSPEEGWPRWMDRQIRESDYVLMICTEPYYRRVIGEERAGTGLGIRWEGNLIYSQLYASGAVNNKFIAVLFDEQDAKYIPVPEQGFTYYVLPQDYEELYRLLTDQPLVAKPPVGNIRRLPSQKYPDDQQQSESSTTSVLAQRTVFHNLPQPNYQKFIGREEELAKAITILKPYPFSQHALVTIDGVGGIGKSALALEIAYYFLRQRGRIPDQECFDTIIWTSAKPNELLGDRIMKRHRFLHNLNDIYKAIATTLGESKIIGVSRDELHESIRQILTQYRVLLIVDNLETIDDEEVIEFLYDLPAPTKAIVTTRHRIDVAYPIRLSGMNESEALELIEDEAEKRAVQITNAEMQQLYKRTGGVPAAIVWSIAQMGFGYNVAATLTRLGDPSGDIAQFCFQSAVDLIRETNAHKLLLALAHLGGKANRHDLGRVANLPPLDRDDGLVSLEKLSLVNKTGEIFELLPLTLIYTRAELAQSANAARQFEKEGDYWTEFLTGIDLAASVTSDIKETAEFDVFLAHRSVDKDKVEAIGEALKQKGLTPWLDKEQIPPGRWFQDVIQQAIATVKSAAIFIGEQGLGRWEALELRSFISQCVERGIPVIPVLLPGVERIPDDLLFLRELNWVRFTTINDPEAIKNLYWGITGERV